VLKVLVKVHPNGESLPLPNYTSAGSTGADLYAAVTEDTIIKPNTTVIIPTGISISLPDGYEGQVRPRSGLASRYSIGMLNAPGTIDSDYRGEIMVPLTNLSSNPYTVKRGDRIAQLVIAQYMRIDWTRVKELQPSLRGDGGFGHSGR